MEGSELIKNSLSLSRLIHMDLKSFNSQFELVFEFFLYGSGFEIHLIHFIQLKFFPISSPKSFNPNAILVNVLKVFFHIILFVFLQKLLQMH